MTPREKKRSPPGEAKRSTPGDLPRSSRRKPCRVILGRSAAEELREALDHLERQSTGAGKRLLDEIDRCVKRLRRFPESAPVDPDGSALLFGPEAKARSTHEGGYSIRYVYPATIGTETSAILVVSIRHGRRLPVDDQEYMKRFLTEILRARAERK